MNIRVVLFGCLLLTTACQPAEETKPSDPPQARPQIVKPKDDSELLIGSWELVGLGDPPIVPKWKSVMEFTRDGKVHISHQDRNGDRRDFSGMYKLDGRSLWISIPAMDLEPSKMSKLTIDSIRDDELVLLGPANDEGIHERSVRSRVKPK